jgi:hypothetical protein
VANPVKQFRHGRRPGGKHGVLDILDLGHAGKVAQAPSATRDPSRRTVGVRGVSPGESG